MKRPYDIAPNKQPDGTARSLWTEAVPLQELGRLEIHRASMFEFDNTTQQWEVKDPKGQVRFFSTSRAACLEWEQRNLLPIVHALDTLCLLSGSREHREQQRG